MSQNSHDHSNTLEPPKKSTDLEDPGAHELSSEGEEYFSDASEGQDRSKSSRPVTPSHSIPKTRVEKLDEAPSHGEVPGTDAYDKRKTDAAPDEIEIVREEPTNLKAPRQHKDSLPEARDSSIPITVVEEVDSAGKTHDEGSGTNTSSKRSADATPDVIITSSDPGVILNRVANQSHEVHTSATHLAQSRGNDTEHNLAFSRGPNPELVQSQVESETVPNAPISVRRRSTLKSTTTASLEAREPEDSFGDDFDDFEEGANAVVEDDFGDFDDFEAEQDPADDVSQAERPELISQLPPSTFPSTDLDDLSGLPDLLSMTRTHLDAMFPSTIDHDLNSTSKLSAHVGSVFPTERSVSLWKQLITPPALQPPNWTQSRIRRLFLISLGVPVDLDEVLPPVKQNKLILPDIDLATNRASTSAEPDSVKKLKNLEANDSSVSLSSQTSGANTKSRGRLSSRTARTLPAPPPFDITAAKRLCGTTSERLESMEEDELESHVKELELQSERASKLLEYWLGRRDELRKEKEAFEGVVENLVKHAKRIRTLK